MLILSSSNPDRACELLGRLVEDGRQCSMIVFGDCDRARAIAACAEVRAQAHPFRTVVRVLDPSLLAREPRFAMLLAEAEAGVEAVAMTTTFRISGRLRGTDALDHAAVERAFARALAGEVAGEEEP